MSPPDPAAPRPAYEALLDAAGALPDGWHPAHWESSASDAIEALSTYEPRVGASSRIRARKAGVGPVSAPVLLLGMESDPRVAHSNVAAFEWTPAAAGKTVASQYYDGPGHVATLNVGYSPMQAIDGDEPRGGVDPPRPRLSGDRLRDVEAGDGPAITRRWISDVPSKIV